MTILAQLLLESKKTKVSKESPITVRIITIPNAPQGDTIVYTSSEGEESRLIIMDTSRQTLQNISPANSQELEAKWRFDGHFLSFVSIKDENWDIYTINIATNERIQLTNR